MRQEQITIGMTARVKIGSRLAEVRVLRRLDGRGRARYECMTQDTGRVIKATAARLRPMVEAAPRPPRLRELSLRSYREYDDPAGIRTGVMVERPQPIPGIVSRVGNGDIVAVSAFDGFHRIVRTAVDRLHVSEPWRVVAWAVRHRIRECYRYLSVPRSLRRGMLYEAAKRHAYNRQTYRAIMGTAPFPTEEMIGRAIMGTDADRAALLRHADRLAAGN